MSLLALQGKNNTKFPWKLFPFGSITHTRIRKGGKKRGLSDCVILLIQMFTTAVFLTSNKSLHQCSLAVPTFVLLEVKESTKVLITKAWNQRWISRTEEKHTKQHANWQSLLSCSQWTTCRSVYGHACLAYKPSGMSPFLTFNFPVHLTSASRKNPGPNKV